MINEEKNLNVISIIKILDQKLSLIIKNSWMNIFLSDFPLVVTKLFKRSKLTISRYQKLLGHLPKNRLSRTNNGNAQMLELLSNIKSSSAKIRVPDPLLV